MSNARSSVADPPVSTESKILNGTCQAVTRMPERNPDCISADFRDANLPRPDSQERTIVKDTCDSIITLQLNHQENFLELDLSDDDLHELCDPWVIAPELST